ncbi:MAG: hypothetical protein O2809_04975 [Proteobacteria bacterium]|nr:hypothetical protein [Pseudomonadota bacterium]
MKTIDPYFLTHSNDNTACNNDSLLFNLQQRQSFADYFTLDTSVVPQQKHANNNNSSPNQAKLSRDFVSPTTAKQVSNISFVGTDTQMKWLSTATQNTTATTELTVLAKTQAQTDVLSFGDVSPTATSNISARDAALATPITERIAQYLKIAQANIHVHIEDNKLNLSLRTQTPLSDNALRKLQHKLLQIAHDLKLKVHAVYINGCPTPYHAPITQRNDVK